ncbi:MAG TPA: glycosyltransferase family 4 protein [Bacteroidia bacterium]|nr:glycosyltransferase family 4 protein [Bacteroidia bacterium]HNU34368.1 glycosyltransferase family 4 protein [Bacteroidia bacterium]
MRILLVHKFWRKTGGAENYFQDTAAILRANGHVVKIFTTDFPAANSSDVFARDENVVFGEYEDYLDGNILKKLTAIPEIIYSKKNKALFGKLLDNFKPDIVHVFALFTTISPSVLNACRERNIPVVMSCNDYKHICPNYRLFHNGKICEACKGNKFYNAALKNCCKHSVGVSVVSAVESYAHHFTGVIKNNISAFLFESKFMLEKTKEFWGDKYKYEFVGKPFDVKQFAPSAQNKNYVLYAGRLSDEKGVDVLIKAMQYNHDIPLVIAGSGPEEEKLKQLVSSLQLKNISFKGIINADEIKQLMSYCSFVVIPSVWYENFPYVLAEAYAHSKPVIGSNMGGIPEYIIEGETGMVYNAYNEKELAEKINKFFANKNLIMNMGKNARQFSEDKLNARLFYERLLSVYNSIVKPQTLS